MRGSPEVLEGVKDDLRQYDELVDLLPEPEAIYIGHPSDDRDYMAAITLTTIYDGSTPHRGAVTKDYRVQVTVKVTREWREGYDSRENQPAALTQMAKMLTLVGTRLDKSSGMQEAPLGAESGADPMEMDDGRLAMAGDWRLRGTYLE